MRPVDYPQLLLQHLDLIDRVIAFVTRRHHLSAYDTEEFTSTVRFKLIDKDFAILRKFQGRSNLSTYLTTVIERLYLDFCIARWGKWRPSMAARRLGPVAILLEQLISRDGLTFNEAVGTLHTNHGVTATRDELHEMFMQLPARFTRRLAGEEELSLVASRGGVADVAFEGVEDVDLVEQLEALLLASLAALPDRDQLILKLRYQDNLSVAAIARLLHQDADGLYKQFDLVIGRLRDLLERDGIRQAHIDRVIGHPALILGRIFGGPGDRNDESV